MVGTIGILNVGAGDTKLTFDKNNPAELIRSKRIVMDMLRRGYALLVEIDDGKGGKHFARATAFREDTCEYIIADFDPTNAVESERHAETIESTAAVPATEGPEESAPAGLAEALAPASRGIRRGKRAVAADTTRAVAVSRSAGG